MKKKIDIIPKILFLTGLPSSGKTSLAISLKKKLKKLGLKKIKYIDGDLFRKKFKFNQYDKKSRNLVGDKKIRFAKTFLRLKKFVIITGVAHDKFWRRKIKKNNNDIVEVFTKCPLKVCQERDFKKNYFKAQNKDLKNFVGINYMYQEGNSVDITLNMYRNTVSTNTNKLIKYLKFKKYVYRK